MLMMLKRFKLFYQSYSEAVYSDQPIYYRQILWFEAMNVCL